MGGCAARRSERRIPGRPGPSRRATPPYLEGESVMSRKTATRSAALVAGLFLVTLVVFQARALSSSPAPAPAPAADPVARVVAEGRLTTYPGAEVLVASEVAGTIVRLPLEEKQRVRKGDLVAELRADDLRAELAEAKARLVEAEAEIRLAE